MTIARSFRDLNVYRKARETAQKIFELSRQFPAEERYSLTDQVRRSSRAVKAMIAEAWGRRRYKAVFVNKLDEAPGEATETQSWLDDARDSNYLSDDEFNEVDSNCIVICRMLSRMIDRAEDFCKYFPDRLSRNSARRRKRIDERPVIQTRRVLRVTTSHIPPITSHA